MPKWFNMKRVARGAAQINIMSDIGYGGVSAQDFRNALTALGPVDEIHLFISSDGGDVTAGFAIYDMLARNEARKIVTIQGLAASMASVIAMAGDEIEMPSNAMMMVHNPWGQAIGGSKELASLANGLQIMQDNIANTYRQRTGLSDEEITGMMDAETWLSAEQAVKKGFADRISDPVKMAASFSLARFNKVPSKFAEKNAAASRSPRSDSRSKPQESTMPKNTTTNEDDADFDTPAVETTAEIRAGLLESQKEIRALCALGGMPDAADAFIEEDKSVSEVVAALAEKKAEAEKKKNGKGKNGNEEISARNNARTNGDAAPSLDPTKIWAKFNSAGRNRRAA